MPTWGYDNKLFRAAGLEFLNLFTLWLLHVERNSSSGSMRWTRRWFFGFRTQRVKSARATTKFHWWSFSHFSTPLWQTTTATWKDETGDQHNYPSRVAVCEGIIVSSRLEIDWIRHVNSFERTISLFGCSAAAHTRICCDERKIAIILWLEDVLAQHSRSFASRSIVQHNYFLTIFCVDFALFFFASRSSYFVFYRICTTRKLLMLFCYALCLQFAIQRGTEDTKNTIHDLETILNSFCLIFTLTRMSNWTTQN